VVYVVGVEVGRTVVMVVYEALRLVTVDVRVGAEVTLRVVVHVVFQIEFIYPMSSTNVLHAPCLSKSRSAGTAEKATVLKGSQICFHLKF
jgi:hypothetical protein